MHHISPLWVTLWYLEINFVADVYIPVYNDSQTVQSEQAECESWNLYTPS